MKIASATTGVRGKSVDYVVEKTAVAQDKAVFGVYDLKDLDHNNRHLTFCLGDGHVLVCSEGGDIETGDYICSSNAEGHGMKQDDDLLHNYTVAKASEAVDWSTESSTTKLIACTYHAA